MIKSIFSLSALVLLAICFFSCGSDDVEELVNQNNNELTLANLEGSWQVATWVSANCDIADNDESITYSCPDFCITYTFNSDGTFEFHEREDGSEREYDGEFSIQSDNTMQMCPDTFGCFTTTATINNNQLTLKFDDDDCEDTIVLTR